jgi:transposase
MKKVFVLGERRKSGKRAKGKKAKTPKQLKLLEGERLFVGIDVHKRTYTVAIWSSERKLLTTWTQPSDDELVVAKLSPIADHVAEVVYEAGPTGFTLARALRAAGFNTNVIAPSQTPEKKGRHSKNDPRDSRTLAEYACKDLLRRVYVPTPQEEADRQVTRMREAQRKKLQRTKCQIKSFLLMHGIAEPDGLKNWAAGSVDELHRIELGAELRFSLDTLLIDYEHQVAQMKRLTAKVEELAESDRHREAVKYMRTVGGVGLITAVTMRTELPSPERFEEGTEITASIGFVPYRIQSGNQEYEGPIEKMGNSHLRAALVEGAWRWVARDPAARAHYDRLVANTGNGKKAIVGVARKLAILLWRLETRGEEYRPAA